jgi:CRP/FNR family transcriptional regulator/CRP/FNR family cyclic AMP-dependent transcriptional regulator
MLATYDTPSLRLEVLQRAALLRGLPAEELEPLLALTRRRRYRRGDVLFHQGDPGHGLHFVIAGHLKVVQLRETGEELILSILGPGDIAGEMALLDGAPRSATVVALEEVETATLGRADFLDLLRRSPETVRGLLAVLAQTIRRLDAEVGDLRFTDLQGRLAKRLLELAGAHGRPTGKATEIRVALTQEELAGLIGATRQRVNKLLGIYEEQGAIARQRRRIVILRPELLRQWAGL